MPQHRTTRKPAQWLSWLGTSLLWKHGGFFTTPCFSNQSWCFRDRFLYTLLAVPSNFLHSTALESHPFLSLVFSMLSDISAVCIKSMWWLWVRLGMLQLSLDHHSRSYHNMTRPTISSFHLFDIPYLIHITLFDHDVIKYVPMFGPWMHLSILVCIFVLEDDIRNHKDILWIET